MSRPPKDFVADSTLKLRKIIGRLRRQDFTEDDLAELETFIAIAMRVIAKTNPSKVREMTRQVEIAYYMKRLPDEQQKDAS